MTNGRKVTEVAQAAKAVRAALKAAFPGMMFSVKSESFSMGNAVRVAWTNGPAVEAVDAIVQAFRSGDFDGMTDSYNYRRDGYDGPTAKYVTCDRRIDSELKDRVAADIRAMFATEPREGAETLAYRILRKSDLRNGYAGVKSCEGFPGFQVISEVR